MKDFHNTFAGAFVDRSGERRQDAAWLKESIKSNDSLFVPIWDGKCLAVGDPWNATLLQRPHVNPYLDHQDIIFLGYFREKPAFALGIDSPEAPLSEHGEFHDLRYLGDVLPADEANLVAHARALVIWHQMQKYCGLCGSPSNAKLGGNSRVCSNAACGKEMFPRVSPAIIVIVSDGDRCLLGRQESWPESRYSTIAGFVEPGESLEDAVRREVLEETNIGVSNIRYHSSQPWPFPSALMLGFCADATTHDIQLVDIELEDAQWFTRKQLRSGFPKLPYRLSIARQLVDDWLNADTKSDKGQ